jgi:hypothetical protein
MNGVHDMGGMQCMGPVRPEKNEPVFHERWEARVLALVLAMFAWRKWNLDAFRYETYMDGNGRIGRFLMNVMMASRGYPWTVVPVGDRNAYVSALEKASVGEDIAPFADFLASLVKKGLAGEPLPAVPKGA